MEISILLATYKRPEILHRTLESFSCLECATLQWDLWVIDNAFDPATETVVKSWAKKLPINYLVEPQPGKNNALNRAIPEVHGQLIVFTDDDIIATSDWLIQLWQGTQRWPEHAVFGGRVLPDWPEGFLPHDLRNPFLNGAYAIADWNLPEGSYSPKKLFGANMVVRKRIFDEGWRFEGMVGPSQKSNYIMGSETEFVLRLEAAGYAPIYLPNALVYHQIRPEQMSYDWLVNRAYRAGRGEAWLDEMGDDVKTIFGYPRYLIRRTFETLFSYGVISIFNKKKKLEHGMRFYYNLGRLIQYKEKVAS